MAKFSFRIFSCVVRGLPFYIGVVVPVTLILTKNFIVLMLVLRGITNSQFKKNKKRELMVSARIAFACSILLGTTWIFGILAIGDLSYFFQCLFCVFNSFQGCLSSYFTLYEILKQGSTERERCGFNNLEQCLLQGVVDLAVQVKSVCSIREIF